MTDEGGMDNEPLTLRDFLGKSNLAVAKEPPLVHSTQVQNIWKVKKSGKLLAMPCSVFKAEKLCYCFVGRPAYKQDDIDNPQRWQLPMAFVLRFHEPPSIKRIFPFDSGAFMQHRLPDYVTGFDLEGFDISSDRRNIGRLISLVYRTPDKYFDRAAAGFEEITEQHEMTLRHQEIMAVCRLALDNSSRKCDDRAAAIEVSLDQDVVLTHENVLGIVVPEEVTREPSLMKWLFGLTPNIETYSHFPLSLHAHYGQIYQAVRQIYKKAGVRL
ncbi:hypothetical protein [Methylobacterium indicum]|uniref:hypothetical protein n=1 Tax=Methylobacterium indicum TaxID=1775910 RepID=UPI001A91F242|nr:hypothetical protein [Methylobacterium indicum]